MMKTLLTLILLITCLPTFGQTFSDSITMKKVFGGYHFYQADKKLTMRELVKTMEPNEQAYKQIKKAQSTNGLAMAFAFTGGALVGFPLGTAIGGGDPNWALVGIGAGLIVVSIPISNKFNRQAKYAVETFNNDLQTSSFWDKHPLRFSVNATGVGLSLKL